MSASNVEKQNILSYLGTALLPSLLKQSEQLSALLYGER